VNVITRSSPAVRPTATTAAGWLTVVAAVGTALLSVAHMGVDVPLLSAIGPGGDRAVPVAAVAFGVGALVYAVVAAGLFGRRRWAWAAGVAVSVLSIASGLGNFRGAASAAGIAVSLAVLALLLTPAMRAWCRRRR
jgi:hypothetical protein